MDRVICSDYFSVCVFTMKLKQLPADFVVQEIPDYPVSSEKNEQSVYVLQKQGIDSFDALRRIAQKLHISLFKIEYEELKDKHTLAR